MQPRRFYQFYSLSPDLKAHSKGSASRELGLKSIYGQAGSILAHFGWTWHYLLEQIPWAIVLRMLADAPRYDYSDTAGTAPEEHITQDQARDFLSSLGKVIT